MDSISYGHLGTRPKSEAGVEEDGDMTWLKVVAKWESVVAYVIFLIRISAAAIKDRISNQVTKHGSWVVHVMMS